MYQACLKILKLYYIIAQTRKLNHTLHLDKGLLCEAGTLYVYMLHTSNGEQFASSHK
jgi:hypothetical protein